MKLVFEKKDLQTVIVKIDREEQIRDFDYVEMIKGLLQCGALEESELKGEFSETEKTSIASMVKHLNECVTMKESETDTNVNAGEKKIGV